MTDTLEPNFILNSDTAREIYEGLRCVPIVDVHTHMDGNMRNLPDNAWDLFCAGDHYKTQRLYLVGMPPEDIDGDRLTPREKWGEFAKAFPGTAGTIVYDSLPMTLRRLFDANDTLNGGSADRVWSIVNRKLTDGQVALGDILAGGNNGKHVGPVETICTCDAPWLEGLESYKRPIYTILDGHKNVSKDSPFRVGMRVEPVAYPMKFARIGGSENPLEGLEKIGGRPITDFKGYVDAFRASMERFQKLGNTSLDLSMRGNPQVYDVSDARATEIIQRALRKEEPTLHDERDFMAAMLPVFMDAAYNADIPMMLKIGVLREANPHAPRGAHDCVDGETGLNGLIPILQRYEQKALADKKEWTVLLTVRNRGDYQQQADLATRFRNVYWGGDWWDSDNVEGMARGLSDRASWSGLARCVPFFSDTRSPPDIINRFDMKKRVAANYLADLVVSRGYDVNSMLNLGWSAFYHTPKRLFKL